ncbi:uncharacterized protein LOC125504514, partial [Dendroctonus ponderosae]|uniref:uncharacterized protein LOC125504514 n=1 Tax=Dendroctonus ponderosae TaxID=77166 RepID=UPI0020364518
MCQADHFIFSCQDFLKLTPQQRFNKIKKLNACRNCLRVGHQAKECRNQYSCKKCSERHNTLLHFETPQFANHLSINQRNHSQLPTAGTNDSSFNSPFDLTQSQSVVNHIKSEPYIMLSTAIISVLDRNGKPHSCRVLLDNCSQSNFITSSMCSKLRLSTAKISHKVEGFGSGITSIFQKTNITLKSQVNSFKLENIPFLITDQISRNLPSFSFDNSLLQIPDNIVLADKRFNESSSIDMLLGASVFWSLICVGQILLPNSGTVLQKTKFGWILSGPLPLNPPNNSICNLSLNSSQYQAIHDQLESFWRLEEFSNTPNLSQEELDCEEHFINTTSRDSSGRFVVHLPVKGNLSDLGESYEVALKRFYAMERKLNKDPVLRDEYVNFISEYERLGHMSKINSNAINSENVKFYLPHHGVVKQSSTTTKLRVVFDGSVKSSSGISLNDTLKVGPKLQDDLMDLLLNFRTHKVAFTADIEKMYRCVMLNKPDRELHRILFRSSLTDELNHYQLNTVTYGTSCASFLAIRALRQVAIDMKDQYPTVSNTILSHFYVDDLLSGSSSVEEANQTIKDLTRILQSYGFNLRKFVSSSPQVLDNIHGNQSASTNKVISDDKTIKTLGLTWNSHLDTFQYTFHITPHTRVTKRTILSTVAKIFDPLGLVGPCVVKAKLMLQQLWQLGTDWDESVPLNLHRAWMEFETQIPMLNDIFIPRHAICSDPVLIELHCFSDA